MCRNIGTHTKSAENVQNMAKHKITRVKHARIESHKQIGARHT